MIFLLGEFNGLLSIVINRLTAVMTNSIINMDKETKILFAKSDKY